MLFRLFYILLPFVGHDALIGPVALLVLLIHIIFKAASRSRAMFLIIVHHIFSGILLPLLHIFQSLFMNGAG